MNKMKQTGQSQMKRNKKSNKRIIFMLYQNILITFCELNKIWIKYLKKKIIIRKERNNKKEKII